MVIVTLIAAVSADGFISRDKGVPWDLPADKAHYRRYTDCKWLLLGRTTYEEMLGGWFRDHVPLVLSRDHSWQPPVGRRVSSAAEAVALAEAAGQPELVVCGGRAAFDQAMPLAHRLVLTRVEAKLGRGIAFPAVEAAEWQVTKSESHPGDPSFRIEWLRRSSHSC